MDCGNVTVITTFAKGTISVPIIISEDFMVIDSNQDKIIDADGTFVVYQD